MARRVAHMYYRSEIELDNRFQNQHQGDEDPLAGGRYAVQSYLEHQDDKLIARNWPVRNETAGSGIGAMSYLKSRRGREDSIAAITPTERDQLQFYVTLRKHAAASPAA